LSGLFDGDGTELKEGGLQLASVNRMFLSDLQKLLSTLGIQSKIVPANDAGMRLMPDQHGGEKEYYCQKTERICIGSVQMQQLISMGLNCERMAFNKYPQRDASQFVYVTDITSSGVVDKVYCFNEPKNHTGIFNGVLTGQCGEITLESSELCNLVETFPNHHESLEDYQTTLKFAYLYAKSITLLNTHWAETNRVMLRNRRIGISMSGIAQFISNRNLNELKIWMEEGYKTAKYYDRVYSEWLAIPESIKMTTIKPSGTASLLAGATPGIHFPESKYYIRRVRLANDSSFIKSLKKAGYNVEAAFGQEDSTSVVEFPIFAGENVRTIDDVSMWEQLGLAAFAQKYWSGNSVSITVTFDKDEEKDIKNALNIYQFQLKAVSFLPKLDSSTYPQMPYEAITKEVYESMSKKLKPLNFSKVTSEAIGEKYCTNDSCTI